MQGSTVLSVIALSRYFAYMHNSRSLTPSRCLESTILANYGVRVLCLSQCLILNQTDDQMAAEKAGHETTDYMDIRLNVACT